MMTVDRVPTKGHGLPVQPPPWRRIPVSFTRSAVFVPTRVRALTVNLPAVEGRDGPQVGDWTGFKEVGFFAGPVFEAIAVCTDKGVQTKSQITLTPTMVVLKDGAYMPKITPNAKIRPAFEDEVFFTPTVNSDLISEK